MGSQMGLSKLCPKEDHLPKRHKLPVLCLGRFKRGKGDFLVVFGIRLGVQPTIMHYSLTKQ